MALSADSSTSPCSPVTTADGGSPQATRSLASPWAQVVRAGSRDAETATVTATRSPEQLPVPDFFAQKCSPDNDVSEPQSESSHGTNGALGPPKKPAWNKPLNGVAVEAGSVMGGAGAWPALSESTKSTHKSSLDSPKPVIDGSVTVSQLPQKQDSVSHSNGNDTMSVRQRSVKHRGGGSNRIPSPPPPPLPPPFPVIPYESHLVPPVLEPRLRCPILVGGVPSQPHASNDHSSSSHRNSSHRNPNRKGNLEGRPRGDGSYYHNNHGGRRDQDRRDAHFGPPPPGRFISPQSPGSGPFVTAPLIPFPGPVGYDMPPQFIYVPTLSPDSFRGVPIIPSPLPSPPPPTFFFPVVDPNLPALVVKQIEYYFSDANLVKDDFLRSKMDEEGWVPIALIAKFPRVVNLTNNIQFILDCLTASAFVELQDDRVRRRDGWKKWIHTNGRLGADFGSQTPSGSTENAVTSSFEKASLDESGDDALVEVAANDILEELTSKSKLV